MRRRTLVALAAVAALAAGTGVDAGPASCASPCTVHVSGFGFVPEGGPLLTSGTVVRFTTAEETSHPTTDHDNPFARCFSAPVGYGEPDAFVRFDIVDAAVQATVAPGTQFAETRTCATAVEVSDGSFALPYHCKIHQWLRSGFVIEPAA